MTIKYGIIGTNLIRESFYDCSQNLTKIRVMQNIENRITQTVIELMKENGTTSTDELKRQMNEFINEVICDIDDDRDDSNDLYLYNANGIALKARIHGKHILITKSKYTRIDEYGDETYCLPNDWFENGEAPYKYREIEE